jgi:hypothetical protein
MRQVLELLASLISLNPDRDISDTVTDLILQRLLSIITHQSAQPLVKPAFKSLECFLGKGTISTTALIDSYRDRVFSNQSGSDRRSDRYSSWNSFISEVFEWLTLPDVSPAAGKFLVTLFIKLRNKSTASQLHTTDHTVLWQQWIRSGLRKNPETLENVKNYIFPPLFKLDRAGSLLFLGDLNSQGPISGLQIQDSNAQSLLQLAAIEVGKKSGLVEDPSMNLPLCNCIVVLMYLGTIQLQKKGEKSTKSVILEEAAIGDLLIHASETVRSLAFSVLVSSSSSIRPFSAVALNLLQLHMGLLFTDTDAKFRNDILSNTKHMIERLRGATTYLTREVENIKFMLSLEESAGPIPEKRDQELWEEISDLLKIHERFLYWYLDFLSGELIPTASYQRHITALKAIVLLLRTGILETGSSAHPATVSDNATTWPFTIKFFTSATMRLILDLLMDPFEDVRVNATVVLQLASRGDFEIQPLIESAKITKLALSQPRVATYQPMTRRISGSRRPSSSTSTPLTNHAIATPQILLDFIDRAQDISKRTGRADYADGVARSFEILYGLSSTAKARLTLIEDLVDQLDPKVRIAEENLAQAVAEVPIHGTFAALKYVPYVYVNTSTNLKFAALFGKQWILLLILTILHLN